MEIFFSIVQRKVIKPPVISPTSTPLAERLLAFQDRYNTAAEPFDWHFGRKLSPPLDRLLERLTVHEPFLA